jgi:hypothetical protein
MQQIHSPFKTELRRVFEAGDKWAKKWAGSAKKFDWFGFLVYESLFN